MSEEPIDLYSGDALLVNRNKYLDPQYRDGFEDCRKEFARVQRQQHPDSLAVDRFTTAMKSKLAKKRADGRGGWDDPAQCPVELLWELLRGHVEKGDPVDIGNLAMMIWNRQQTEAA